MMVVLTFCFTLLYLNAPVLTHMRTPLITGTFSKSRDSLLITAPKSKDASTKATMTMTRPNDTGNEDNNDDVRKATGVYNITKSSNRAAEGYEDRRALHGRIYKSRLQQNSGDNKVPNYCGVSYSDSMDLLSRVSTPYMRNSKALMRVDERRSIA